MKTDRQETRAKPGLLKTDRQETRAKPGLLKTDRRLGLSLVF